MNFPETKRQNRRALLFLLLGIVLTLILLSLPLFSFEAQIYTKKSANTFVGDEKYTAAKAEVEAVAEEYRTQGFEVSLHEDVLERVNSKGKTTSLVTFTLSQTYGKNLFSFLGKGFASSHVLSALLLCLGLSALLAAAGYASAPDLLHRYLDRRSRILRGAACAAALIALLLVPVLIMMNNYAFSRQLGLYNAGLMEEGKELFFSRMDRFLFDGQMGESVADALGGLNYRSSGLAWLLLPAIGISLLAAIQLRCGAIKNSVLRGLLYFFVVVVCLITLYPYYVMTITAFRSNAETLDMYLLNSLMVAGGATAVAMLCGIPAAYAMARMSFRGKKAFLGFVIMSQMFSPVVLLIGISQLMNTLHLNDSVVGLMLINAAFNQAFAIWLLRGTFVSISPEMEQAALIDGCGTVGALTRVLIPMAAPGIVTALIFVFINAWNEYTISTVLISTASNRPITVGITQFSSFNMIEWQYLFAASLLATIPVVILFMSIEKHLTAGLTSGGVKG